MPRKKRRVSRDRKTPTLIPDLSGPIPLVNDRAFEPNMTILAGKREEFEPWAMYYTVQYTDGKMGKLHENDILDNDETMVYQYWDKYEKSKKLKSGMGRPSMPEGKWEARDCVGWRILPNNTFQVKVHWAGFRPKEPIGLTWEPEEDMRQVPGFSSDIENYIKKNPKPQGMAARRPVQTAQKVAHRPQKRMRLMSRKMEERENDKPLGPRKENKKFNKEVNAIPTTNSSDETQVTTSLEENNSLGKFVVLKVTQPKFKCSSDKLNTGAKPLKPPDTPSSMRSSAWTAINNSPQYSETTPQPQPTISPNNQLSIRLSQERTESPDFLDTDASSNDEFIPRTFALRKMSGTSSQ